MQTIRVAPFSKEPCGSRGNSQNIFEKANELVDAHAFVRVLADSDNAEGEKLGVKGALDKILKHYFLNVPLGQVSGWEAGLKYYFNVSLREVNGEVRLLDSENGRILSEQDSVARIASLLLIQTNPERFRPIPGQGYYPDSGAHAGYINKLNKLLLNGAIHRQVAIAALAAPPGGKYPPEEPYDYVRARIISDAYRIIRNPMIENQITKILTSIDPVFQRMVEDVLDRLGSSAPSMSNTNPFGASSASSRLSGALVVVNENGNVLAQHGIGPEPHFDHARLGVYPIGGLVNVIVAWAYLVGDPTRSLNDQFTDTQTNRSVSVGEALNNADFNLFSLLYSDRRWRDVGPTARNLLTQVGVSLGNSMRERPLSDLSQVKATPEQIARIFLGMFKGAMPSDLTSVIGFTLRDGSVHNIRAKMEELRAGDIQAGRQILDATGGSILSAGQASTRAGLVSSSYQSAGIVPSPRQLVRYARGSLVVAMFNESEVGDIASGMAQLQNALDSQLGAAGSPRYSQGDGSVIGEKPKGAENSGSPEDLNAKDTRSRSSSSKGRSLFNRFWRWIND